MAALPRDAAPHAIRRLDYRAPAFLAPKLELAFELEADATNVVATFDFRRNPRATPADRATPLLLDAEGARGIEVELDGEPLAAGRYALTARTLTVLDPPPAGRLRVRSTICPAANTELEGLYVSSGVLCTQCEPEGFRRIAPFLDRPDVLAEYTVTIIADRARYPVLLSNGNRTAAGALDRGRHYATWHDPFPKPTYLFALVAGDLASLEDRFRTKSGRDIALEIWSTPANLARCSHAMASLKSAMRWDEERFGREYDLDTFMIFCADDFNMGAMENKGLNIFNSKLLLAAAETATDDDYQAIEAVVGHEYFHNWTGNRITCRDWFQLSLKEGLTVFRDQEFSSDLGSRAVERIAAVDFLRTHQFPEDAGPMAHPVRPDEFVEINNFYTKTVYEKGAELIRMQQTLLGPGRFRRGMDLYFARHDGEAVTCDDFVQAMQDAGREDGGPDLTQFKRWYSQAGTPVVRARGTYDAAARTYTLDVEQDTAGTPGQPVKEPFHVPLAVGLVGPDGRDLPLRLAGEMPSAETTRVLALTEPRQSFVFADIAAAPVPSLLRGFSAPVKLEFDYADADLAFLAAHDADPVNRWDAAQRCFCRAILAGAAHCAAGLSPVLPPALVALIGKLLTDRSADPALLALALTPPDLFYLASLVDTIDVDALVGSRDSVVREIAHAARHAFERAFTAGHAHAGYAPTQTQIGPRMLRNVCLRYLGAIDDAAVRALAVAQFDGADNMTDTIAALVAVNHAMAPERAALFARFETRWRDEPLVLDKWFALQALSHRPDTLPRVRSLLAHPRFNVRNPNRVRSLLGAFALRNWPGFHAADGGGYAFVAEQVLALDPINPQIAAALAGAFGQWRRFAGSRRLQQRAAL
ncbi:MAG: aminopeptidase N, partial [Aromatoleum sp.]|nr:aminopeptidase N [Aromatoleum sp.]